MEIEFDQGYLEELYYYGRTSNKKYRFQPEIIRNYIDRVNRLRIVLGTEELYQMKSLHYEKKKGVMAQIEVIWINKQYRLEFICRMETIQNKERVVCKILNISNHYHN